MGLLNSTCSVIELFGWNPVPIAVAMQPGQFPETLSARLGPGAGGGT